MATITDILFRDLLHDNDFEINTVGDLDTIEGLENFRLALLYRMLTVPGSLVHRPDYGCGLLQYQNAPATLDTQRKLAQKIGTNFARDPRVESVQGVRVEFNASNPSLTVISVRVKPVGWDEIQMQFKPFSEGVA